jgi:hypothetical protein
MKKSFAKKIMVFAFLTLFLMPFFFALYETPSICATAQESITASASSGGRINPSGLTKVSQGSSQQFSINASTNATISSISVDGSNVYFANYTFAQKPPVNYADGNEKVVIVNNQRYILTNAYAYINRTATINVYTADANWNPTSLISMSPNGDTAKDFYVMNFSTSFPDDILICGIQTGAGGNGGFVASYNVTSGVWQWADESQAWLTNILNPYGTTLFIQASQRVFYETTVADLFTPASWKAIAEPNSSWEGRIAYFNGNIYNLQCSSGLSWWLNFYNLTSSTFGITPLMSVNDTVGWPLSDIYPYIWADSNEILFTSPVYNPNGNLWNVYYSTDGENFSLVTSLPAVGGFYYFNGMESHCWANDIGNGLIAVSNTQDNNPSGYIAIMTLQGVIINEGGGFTSHDTGVRFIVDGKYLVTGAEDCAFAVSYQEGVKVVTTLTSLKTYAYTFSNVQTNHKISVSFFSQKQINSAPIGILIYSIVAVIVAVAIIFVALYKTHIKKRSVKHKIIKLQANKVSNPPRAMQKVMETY